MYLASHQARQILRGRKANFGTGIHLEEEKGQDRNRPLFIQYSSLMKTIYRLRLIFKVTSRLKNASFT